MRALFSLTLLLIPFAARGEETRTLANFLSEFRTDPVGAKEKYRGKKVSLEFEVLKRVTEGKRVYYQAALPDAKNARVLFRLDKTYRPTDKLIVTATLKSSTFDKDEKWMYFDPCEVAKEVRVLPPLYTSLELLKKYDAAPKKVAEEMIGKPVEIKGVVRFVKTTSAILEYAPATDATGKIVTDRQGFQKLGRALVTLNFSDGTVKKASLDKGMEIEARGIIESMQAGAIVIRDAKLLNK
jgi:hypothetical protein